MENGTGRALAMLSGPGKKNQQEATATLQIGRSLRSVEESRQARQDQMTSMECFKVERVSSVKTDESV